MTERARRFVVMLVLAFGASVLPCSMCGHAETPATKTMKLGYVELADDPRYADRGTLSRILFTDRGRPYQGSQVALQDAQAIGRVIKVAFSMEKSTGKSVDELVQQISNWVKTDDIHFILADLAAGPLKDLSHRLANQPVVLFNISAPDDSLRERWTLPPLST